MTGFAASAPPAVSLRARALASFRPLPTPADPRALEPMQRARWRSGAGWIAGGVLVGQLAGLAFPWGGASTGGWVWFGLTGLVALAMVGAGVAQLVLVARAEPRRLGSVLGMVALAVVGMLVIPLAGLFVILFGLAHLLTPLAVAAFGVALLVFDPSLRAAAPRPWRAAALGGLVAVLAIAVGLLDSLVLLPMTLVPGMPLTEIAAAVFAAGEGGGVWVPLAWASSWLVAITLLAGGLIRNRRSGRGTAGALLAASVVALLALPATQFSIGMGIADTMLAGGGMSAANAPIMLGAAVLTAIATGLLIGAGRQPGPAVGAPTS